MEMQHVNFNVGRAETGSLQEIWSALDEKHRATIQARIRTEREARFADFPEQTLIWLALLPFCTVALAEACSFPLGPYHQTMYELFTHLYQADLCELAPVSSIPSSADESIATLDTDANCYRLNNTVRQEIIQRFLTNTTNLTPDPARLQAHVSTLGQAIMQARHNHIEVAPYLHHWATLASSATSIPAVAQRFTHIIEQLLTSDDVNEAIRWIEAARPLAEIVGAELERAVQWAAQQIELHHRRAHDLQSLTRFLSRKAQTKAVEDLLNKNKAEDLLNKNKNVWSLHFIGPGGVGKTTLMRHISTSLVPQLGGSACRVDFDYLNPGYPSRAPALLLDQFAQELRLQGNSASSKEFEEFARKAATFHERFTDASMASLSTRQILNDPAFLALLDTFARGVRQLPTPVVFLLDTCEELVKLRPDGTVPESINASFAILEQLHQRIPEMYVIFSGRRPLASAGAGGWTCPSSPHPKRPYLRLHEIWGFSRSEALHYLYDKAQVREALVEPILEKSPAIDQIELFHWPSKHRGGYLSKARFNPFELALYAGWTRDDPELTAEKLRAADANYYIEQRIIGRISNPHLRSLLPAVSLLGSFERETLRELAPAMNADTFDLLFQELASQEWMQIQQFTLAVKSNLRSRLSTYYHSTAAAELATIRQHILPYLKHATLKWPLDRLNVSHVDATLRLLEEEDPHEAAQWWQAMETRLTDEPNAYGWMANLIEQLLGDEGALAEVEYSPTSTTQAIFQPSEQRLYRLLLDLLELLRGPQRIPLDYVPTSNQESCLRPAVLATYAAAMLHTRSYLSQSRFEIWPEVARKLGQDPTPAGRKCLLYRSIAAICRQSFATPLTDADFAKTLALLSQLPLQDFDEQLMAATVAALEALVEHIEIAPPTTTNWPRSLLALIEQVDLPSTSIHLRTFVLTLAGRIARLTSDWSMLEAYFNRALALLPTLAEHQQKWLDWLAPKHIADRVRLEYIRAVYPTLNAPQQTLDCVGQQMPETTDLDADRLRSAILQLFSSQQPVPAALPSYLTLKTFNPDHAQHPNYNVHRSFQPSFCTFSEEQAASGGVEQALVGLQEATRAADQTATNLDIVRAARLSTLRIVRQMRLRDEGYGLVRDRHQFTSPDEHEVFWSLEGLDGLKMHADLSVFNSEQPFEIEMALLHSRWRTMYTLHNQRAHGAGEFLRQTLPNLKLPTSQRGSSPFMVISLLLDELELHEIELTSPPVVPLLTPREMTEIKASWFSHHPDQPLEALILALRCAVLSPDTFILPTKLVRRLGLRRTAQIALDEGELLTLRLPQKATFLLERARDWFEQAQDLPGAFRTTLTLLLTHANQGAREAAHTLLRSLLGDNYAEHIPALLDQLLRHNQHFIVDAEWQSQECITLPPALDTPFLAQVKAALTATGQQPFSLAWRPWLIRMAACAIWTTRRENERQRLTSWLLSHYAAIFLSGDRRLPAELDNWFVREDLRLLAQPMQPATSTFIVSFTSQQSWSTVLKTALSFTMHVLTLATPGVALASLVSPLTSYVQAARQNTELKKAINLAPPARPITFELLVNEITCAACWEGLIISNLRDAGLVSDFQRVGFRRILTNARTRPTPQELNALIAAGNTAETQRFQSELWKKLTTHNPRFSTDITLLDQLFASRATGIQSQVLHLIAPVRETNSVLGLEVEPETHFYEKTTTLPSYYERSLLISAEQLIHRFPRLNVCLLQGPLIEATPRSETDREAAALQRQFAAQLSLQGIPIVIVIPTLPHSLARDVAETFRTLLQDQHIPSADELLAALATARNQIAHAPIGTDDDTLETACDLCLYLARETGGN